MADDLFRANQETAYRIQNMFRGRPKSTPIQSVVKSDLPLFDVTTTPSVSPSEQPQDVGIGSRFLDQISTEMPQDELAPTSTPIASPEAVIAKYREIIKQSGFKDDEENLQRFIEQNNDPNNSTYDFHGLESQSDEVVPPISKVLKYAIDSVPIFSVLSGLKHPLEILSGAFSRYEATKVGFIKGLSKAGGVTAAPEIIKGLTGVTKTEFPEAELRGSNLPEFGDFLRAQGVPEILSATGGLGLDLLTDIPIIGGITKGLKLIGKGAIKQGAKELTEKTAEAATGKLLEMRSSRLGRAIIDMAKGKGMLDIGPTPTAFKQAVRESMGDANLTAFDANTLMNDFNRMIKTRKDAAKDINNAMKGDIASLSKFTPTEQAIIKESRGLIDQGSAKLKNELEYLRTSDPKRYQDLDDLIETVRSNEGHYTTRAFELYTKKNWKPSQEIIDKATAGMLNDGWAKTEARAKEIVQSIINKGEVNVQMSPTRSFKLGPNVFKSRQPLPEYIRNLLGEIEDPRFNLSNTTRKISEAQSHLRIFRWMRENGYVSPIKTAEFSEEVKGGPLAWGAIQGMYTSPDISDTIKGMQRVVENLDTQYMKMMQGIKAFKTVFNPKAQMHNWQGSLFFMAPLSGVSVFNKPQRYKEAIEVINAVKDVRAGKLVKTDPRYQLYRQALVNRVVGNELPNADQIKWLEDFIRNDGMLPETPIGKVTAKVKDVARLASTSYALGDIIPKLATYIDYTKYGKKSPTQATEELYKWFQNPAEVSKLADLARNTPWGMALLNPFMSFRSEAHRILLNALKESPRTRLILSGYLGAHTAFNSAILGMMGMGLKDIGEFFLTRPEAMSETVLNPLESKGQLDLNTRYIDPFNTRGLFAPLLSLAGATGTNPFDYVLDFTAFSPDFGYSNLVTNALLPALTGSGRMGEDLSFGQRIRKTIEAVGPSSITLDIPKGVEAASQGDNPEAIRRAFRFMGIDVEKRNPEYIRSEVARRLVQTLERDEDPTSILRVLKTMGFDEQRMLRNAQRKIALEKRQPKEKQKPITYSAIDRVLNILR